MPKRKDPNATTFISAGNRVISSAMSQTSRRPASSTVPKKKRGTGDDASDDGGEYYEKPPKIALSYEDYRKGHQEEETELSRVEAIARELSTEYPLLDLPLILTILLDYLNPETIYANYAEIKDNLAVLEVSLVPDDRDEGRDGEYGVGEVGMAESGRSGSANDTGTGSSVIGADPVGTRGSSNSSSISDCDSAPSDLPKVSTSSSHSPSGDLGDDERDHETLTRPDTIRKRSSATRATHSSGVSSTSARNSMQRQYSDAHTPSAPRSDLEGAREEEEDEDDDGDLTVLPDRMDKLHLVEARDYGFPLNGYPELGENSSSEARESHDAHRGGVRSPGSSAGKAKAKVLEGEGQGQGEGTAASGSKTELDPIIFLTEMFPTLETLIISHTLRQAHSDLSVAIESLLSIERIRDVQERGDWKDLSDEETDEDVRVREEKGNERSGWKGSMEGDLRGTDSEQEDAVAAGGVAPPRSVARARKGDTRTASPELGVVPKPLALTLPLYGKIHGHTKVVAKRSDGIKVPRVREVKSSSLSPNDRPTYSSRAGMFAALVDPSDQHPATDSDNDSIASSAGGSASAGPNRVGQTRGKRLDRVEAFPPISRASSPAVGKRRPTELPSLVLDKTEVERVHSMASWLADLLRTKAASEPYFTHHMLDEEHRDPGLGLERALQGLQVERDAVIDQIQQIGLLVDQDTVASTCELCVRAAGGDVSIALDLISALGQARAWPPIWVPVAPPGDAPLSHGPPPRDFPPSPQRMNFSRKPQHPQNWKTVSKAAKPKSGPQHPLAEYIPSYARGVTPQDDTPGSLYGTLQSYDLKSCNHFAAEQRQRRAEAMRLAGHYFKSGMRGAAAGKGKEVASYYAAEARRLEADAMRWELQAARQIVERNSAGQDRWVIDIHHLTLAEASAVVREQVQAWHEAFGLAPLPAKPFRIITGVGKHSASHVAVLRPAIANLLDNDGWKVDKSQKAEGFVIVRGVRGA